MMHVRKKLQSFFLTCYTHFDTDEEVGEAVLHLFRGLAGDYHD